ncbi:hypothetical protein HanPSC8_Chr10g0410591 [Helianthus annuus]|nr:hypothetical protein HanPSC8_Chr10g0410591 [Helianthus annuus]
MMIWYTKLYGFLRCKTSIHHKIMTVNKLSFIRSKINSSIRHINRLTIPPLEFPCIMHHFHYLFIFNFREILFHFVHNKRCRDRERRYTVNPNTMLRQLGR